VSDSPALADVIAVACAEAWRGDGEIFASGMGVMQMLGARLARATFEPDLMVSDGEAFYIAGDLPIGGTNKTIEGWIPFRSVFDTLAGGRRHVMMGASQIDKYGNSNSIVTNLAVLDFATPDNSMRLVSVHPGVDVSDVVANTGFELVIPADVPVSRAPSAEEMDAIGRIDPKGLRHREIPS